MLQHIGHDHDNHYLSSESNSIEALVASKSDGKRHLLLAYAMDPPPYDTAATWSIPPRLNR